MALLAGCSRQLAFPVGKGEQCIQLVEGKDGCTPLLDLIIPPPPRPSAFSSLLSGRAPQPTERTIGVHLLPSGVLEADVEEVEEADGGGGKRAPLGVGSLLLILLLLGGSVLSAVMPMLNGPPPAATSSAPAGEDGGANAHTAPRHEQA